MHALSLLLIEQMLLEEVNLLIIQSETKVPVHVCKNGHALSWKWRSPIHKHFVWRYVIPVHGDHF
jgi:hypothetical protein